jgi:saccharopine dehydrogenase-like NADP-dependent oxidoreductase
MSKILIIGAGGVGQVVVHKCAQHPEVFSKIMLASRTKSKCDRIAEDIEKRYGRKIKTAKIDADDVPQLVKRKQTLHHIVNSLDFVRIQYILFHVPVFQANLHISL